MNSQNLINELAEGYTPSKYDEKYLKEKINEILEFMLPIIKNIIKNKEEKETFRLWDAIKEDKEIEKLLIKLIEKIDMPVVIYVASKFKNNRYFGTKIVEEAQKWK
ncbi:MAG: hypothetical protein WC584_00980 [Candidatus Pacearchaeota archaeon]